MNICKRQIFIGKKYRAFKKSILGWSLLPAHPQKILMNLLAFVQFRMEGGNELVTLTGCTILPATSAAPHLFSIRSTDKTHTENVKAS